MGGAASPWDWSTRFPVFALLLAPPHGRQGEQWGERGSGVAAWGGELLELGSGGLPCIALVIANDGPVPD